MTRWGEAPYEALLSPVTVLNQAEMAVIVTDRFSNIIYCNAFAEQLFGFHVRRHIGQSLLSVGIAEEDREQARELARHVLRGGVWEGTFCSRRADGSTVYTRVHAVPMRHPSGSVDAVVIFAREALRSNQREKDRFGLLERIGERLAGSLELEQTLRRMADTLVPQFADHCVIDLFSADKLVRRLSRHAGGWTPPPDTWVDPGEVVVYPPDHFASKAMSRREALLVEDLPAVSFTAPSSGSARLCTELGVTSVIAAPLVARGELLGVMILLLSKLTNRLAPHYDGFDRDLVGAIAGRVALAIDNAMLFEEERETALAFQKNLLPGERPPRVDGLRIAWRYEPARPLESHGQGIQTQVGGDWYDVIPLSAGRVGIVIGDVEGRGPRAAAVMGQLRAALRAFAQDDKSPADILHKLDEWARTMATLERDRYGAEIVSTPLVSCSYFVYDAWSRTLSFANAGHDPPLLIVGDRVGELEFNGKGALLGTRGQGVGADIVFTEETCDLPPGATLVLYTDGLVERRPKEDGGVYYSRDQARQMLREAVIPVAGKDVEAVANAAFNAVPGDIDDDVAILVVRTTPEDLAVEDRSFPAEPIMVSEARRMAAETFAAWGMHDEQAELACLLVSEVVTNVVRHATVTPSPRRQLILEGGPMTAVAPMPGYDDEWDLLPGSDPREGGAREFRLRLRRGASSVWVEVFDTDLRLPRIRNAGATDEGGRGLYLVDQLATRWGSRPTKDGKAVWFEIPLR
jgi:PAS domain S-box-containing protein